MEKLNIRAYHVRFGDAYLIRIPDKARNGKSVTRHILIDVGNAMAGEGGKNDVFKPVIEDIVNQLNGRPLDLYVMTHEHMDHVQGLLYGNKKVFPGKIKSKLDTQYAWLTASSHPDYYARHPKAKEAFDAYLTAFNQALSYVSAAKHLHFSENIQTLLFNNNPNKTQDCVDFLASLAPKEKTFYIHRGFGLRKGKHHGFNEAKFEIWGPEEDTSVYYGRIRPFTLGVVSGDTASGQAPAEISVPAGVDSRAFRHMMERRNALSENLLAIDKAKNNTSIVFTIEWRGWRLLFPADAEEKSWHYMDKNARLKPVHFLKVGHHGSHNGTPHPRILNKILPAHNTGQRKREAVVSTYEGNYNGVPHRGTLNLIKSRCDRLAILNSTSNKQPGEFEDFEFEG